MRALVWKMYDDHAMLPFSPVPAFATTLALLARTNTRAHTCKRKAKYRTASSMSLPQTSDPEKDLLIIGAGDLGYLIAAEWRVQHPKARIIAETRSPKTHLRLLAAGVTPALESDPTPQKASNVIFCIPPPKIPNYDRLIRSATTRVATPDARFIFISSSSVHGDRTLITENTPLGTTTRAQLLADAEQVTLAMNRGAVMRFSGLYSLYRGGHTYWLYNKMDRVSEKRTANLMHRADAAAAVLALLNLPEWPQPQARTFLAASAIPVTGRQMVDALKMHPEYSDKDLPTLFADGVEMRECDSSWTRHALSWKPRWESFVDFMREDGQRVRDGLPSGRLID